MIVLYPSPTPRRAIDSPREVAGRRGRASGERTVSPRMDAFEGAVPMHVPERLPCVDFPGQF